MFLFFIFIYHLFPFLIVPSLALSELEKTNEVFSNSRSVASLALRKYVLRKIGCFCKVITPWVNNQRKTTRICQKKAKGPKIPKNLTNFRQKLNFLKIAFRQKIVWLLAGNNFVSKLKDLLDPSVLNKANK